MNQLLINVGKQFEGYTFRLQPKSRLWLGKQFPDAPRVSTVFISADTKQDVTHVHDQILSQVFTLLTGLSKEELKNLGGLAIFDPQTNQEILTYRGPHVATS